jgi:putative PIN family toxin of toxin-antitoxin system
MSEQDREDLILLLERIADLVSPADHPVPGICRDPDDEPYLQPALAGHADRIVSGDSDLLDLAQVEHIPILSPAHFERILRRTRERR